MAEEWHKQMVRNEKWLAQLHADIYQRREEARSIRISLQNGKDIGKLCQKQKSLYTKTHHDIDLFLSRFSPPPPSYPPWCILLLLVALLTILSLLLFWKMI